MLRNEKGFTLIEIIAVLVILGILAAVAIPKYIGLMEESRTAAAQSAIAELKARASSTYAKQLLMSGSTTTAIIGAAITTDLGDDFGVSKKDFSAASLIVFGVDKVKGNGITEVTGTWVLPQ